MSDEQSADQLSTFSLLFSNHDTKTLKTSSEDTAKISPLLFTPTCNYNAKNKNRTKLKNKIVKALSLFDG